MHSASDFGVFSTWANASEYAFGGKGKPSIVPTEDKEAYWRVYSDLMTAAETALNSHPRASKLLLRPKNYSRERGSRGHRPKDLWVSICFRDAKLLGYLPQVFVIASDKGVEIGFAASIAEDDYFDTASKIRNRAIIPLLNSKLPPTNGPLVAKLMDELASQPGWHYNHKTRLLPGQSGFDRFSSLAEMIGHLRVAGEFSGAGTACKLFQGSELKDLNLEQELTSALNIFFPLLLSCAPSDRDLEILEAQDAVEDAAAHLDFSPKDDADARKKVWAEVARRQGQAAFRRDLFVAYGGACAISGTRVADVLHAAHLTPYNGPKTNHVTNGMLLRADLHTLYDLKLITINPDTMTVEVAVQLQETEYGSLNGKQVTLPKRSSHKPSREALRRHYSSASSSDKEVLPLPEAPGAEALRMAGVSA